MVLYLQHFDGYAAAMTVLDRSQATPIEEILDNLQPRIRSVFSRFQIPPQDAEDVLQQTLLIYLYRRDSIYDPERWLLGALRNRCRLYWRARKRKLYTAVDKALLESVAVAESSPQDSADFVRDLNSLLAELPGRCRSLFRLRYRQGYEAPEAAEKMGYKASSIYKVSERCMAALTRRMVDCGLVDGGCDD